MNGINYPKAEIDEDSPTLNDELESAINEVLDKFGLKADIDIEVFDDERFTGKYDISIQLINVRK